MKIESRPAMLGESINTRCEKHGDETVPAHDIPLAGIMLDAGELDELVAPGAHAALFKRAGRLEEPAFPSLKAWVLKGKFENSIVTLVVGGLHPNALRFEGCTIAKVTLLPLAGGLTQLDCQMQCLSSSVADLPAIVQRLGQDVHIAIEFGTARADPKGTQADLPINTFGEGEQSEGDQGKASTRRRRRKDQAAGTLQ